MTKQGSTVNAYMVRRGQEIGVLATSIRLALDKSALTHSTPVVRAAAAFITKPTAENTVALLAAVTAYKTEIDLMEKITAGQQVDCGLDGCDHKNGVC